MNVTSDEKREKARQIKRRKKTKRKTNQCEIKDNCNRTKQKSTLQKQEKKEKNRRKQKEENKEKRERREGKRESRQSSSDGCENGSKWTKPRTNRIVTPHIFFPSLKTAKPAPPR